LLAGRYLYDTPGIKIFWFIDISFVALLLACLHDHNKSGFLGGPAFIQPIRAI